MPKHLFGYFQTWLQVPCWILSGLRIRSSVGFYLKKVKTDILRQSLKHCTIGKLQWRYLWWSDLLSMIIKWYARACWLYSGGNLGTCMSKHPWRITSNKIWGESRMKMFSFKGWLNPPPPDIFEIWTTHNNVYTCIYSILYKILWYICVVAYH